MSAPLQLVVHTSPTRTLTDGKNTFSPVTSTILLGDTEALLVDTQFVDEDVDALAAKVEDSGRKLTTIFITHGHADHFFGAGRLLEHFPDARVVATRGVTEFIEATLDAQHQQFRQILGDQVISPTHQPEALDGDALTLASISVRGSGCRAVASDTAGSSSVRRRADSLA